MVTILLVYRTRRDEFQDLGITNNIFHSIYSKLIGQGRTLIEYSSFNKPRCQDPWLYRDSLFFALISPNFLVKGDY